MRHSKASTLQICFLRLCTGQGTFIVVGYCIIIIYGLPSKIHNTQITFGGHAHTACNTYNLVSAYSWKRTCRHACKRWRNMQVAIDRNATCSWAQARTWRNYSFQPSRFAFSNIFVDHDSSIRSINCDVKKIYKPTHMHDYCERFTPFTAGRPALMQNFSVFCKPSISDSCQPKWEWTADIYTD